MGSAISKGLSKVPWPRGSLAAGLVLATFAGIASRLPAGGPAAASENSKEAYVLFIKERTRDAGELKTYTLKAGASLAGHPISLLAAYGRQEVLEGPQAEGVVLVRFPSFAQAKAWYDSPAYRAAREHRFKGADYRAILVEGR